MTHDVSLLLQLLYQTTVCAPGFGGVTASDCNVEDSGKTQLQKAQAACQGGKYGPANRDSTLCIACPEATRTFSYAWPTEAFDVYFPRVTSPPQAKSLHDCLADFAQVCFGCRWMEQFPARIQQNGP
jgi:hypothetical protein